MSASDAAINGQLTAASGRARPWFDAGMGVEDATRRTRLATERTYLAWWRSGLTALAVGLAAGKLVPELSSGSAWPYELLGVGYALLGLAFIGYGYRRQQAVEAALRRGEWAPFDPRVAAVLTGAGILLGAATIVLLLFAGS
jgi:putative membrane protein